MRNIRFDRNSRCRTLGNPGQQGRNERGAEKFKQCDKYFFQYSTFASE